DASGPGEDLSGRGIPRSEGPCQRLCQTVRQEDRSALGWWQVGLDGAPPCLRNRYAKGDAFARLLGRPSRGSHAGRRPPAPRRRPPLPLPQARPGALLPDLPRPLEAQGHPAPPGGPRSPRPAPRPAGQPTPVEAEGPAPATSAGATARPGPATGRP